MAVELDGEKAKLWWEIQKNGKWKGLVASLKKSAAIHYHFKKFINCFYWKFRREKNIPDHHYPEIKFEGFKEFEDPEKGNENVAGHCNFNFKDGKIELSIYLNHWFLLDKLGYTHLIKSKPISGRTYYSSNVSFKKLIKTIAHELAHAYQNTVNNFAPNVKRSQCESSGEGERALVINEKGQQINKLIRPKYPELVKEHTKLTKEIKQMIINSPEYQKLKTWWVNNKFPQQKGNDRQGNIKACENCGRDSRINPCQECIEEREFQRLFLLIQKSKDLTNLEKNYQDAKNNTIYKEFDKKIGIDNLYHETKIYLSDVQRQKGELKKVLGISALIIGAILIFGLIAKILPRRKRKKY